MSAIEGVVAMAFPPASSMTLALPASQAFARTTGSPLLMQRAKESGFLFLIPLDCS